MDGWMGSWNWLTTRAPLGGANNAMFISSFICQTNQKHHLQTMTDLTESQLLTLLLAAISQIIDGHSMSDLLIPNKRENYLRTQKRLER